VGIQLLILGGWGKTDFKYCVPQKKSSVFKKERKEKKGRKKEIAAGRD
jgi:hypothetical protein